MSEPVKDLEEVGLVIKGQPGEAPLFELDHAVVEFHIGSLLSPSKLIARQRRVDDPVRLPARDLHPRR